MVFSWALIIGSYVQKISGTFRPFFFFHVLKIYLSLKSQVSIVHLDELTALCYLFCRVLFSSPISDGLELGIIFILFILFQE